MVRFSGIDTERSADAFGREHARGRLDHFICFIPRQLYPFMADSIDGETTLEQLGKKLFTRNGIVGQIAMRLGVTMKFDGIIDLVFCEHLTRSHGSSRYRYAFVARVDE